jgi:nicotinamide-nucleotide amidase
VYFAEQLLVVRGVPEADVAPIIREVLKIDPRLYIKSHPKGFEVDAPLLHIHIYASAEDRERAAALVENASEKLRQILLSKFGDRVEVSKG